MLPLDQVIGDGLFDSSGFPIDAAWKETPQPTSGDPHAYALEVTDESLEPVFRVGTLLLVSPAAPVRRGDRVVVRTQRSEVMVKQLVRRGASRVDLKAMNPTRNDRSFALSEIAWLHRIVWASQ